MTSETPHRPEAQVRVHPVGPQDPAHLLPNMSLCRSIMAMHPAPLIFATVSGAHLYGFPSPDSDYDLRGCHCLSTRLLLSLKDPPEHIMSEEVVSGVEIDLVTFDAGKFCRLLLKKNGYVLEQLLSPLVVHTTDYHAELCRLGQLAITRHHAYHYLGFAQTQWELFEKENPPRVKPLLYTFRTLLTGIHLMRTGMVNAHLPSLNLEYKLPYIPDLIDRKVTSQELCVLTPGESGKFREEYLRLRGVLEEAHARSSLPEVPACREELSDLLVRIRLNEPAQR
jgi:predicted nucleotidyltransferase